MQAAEKHYEVSSFGRAGFARPKDLLCFRLSQKADVSLLHPNKPTTGFFGVKTGVPNVRRSCAGWGSSCAG
jgi:hypothetical protein